MQIETLSNATNSVAKDSTLQHESQRFHSTGTLVTSCLSALENNTIAYEIYHIILPGIFDFI